MHLGTVLTDFHIKNNLLPLSQQTHVFVKPAFGERDSCYDNSSVYVCVRTSTIVDGF